MHLVAPEVAATVADAHPAGSRTSAYPGIATQRHTGGKGGGQSLPVERFEPFFKVVAQTFEINLARISFLMLQGNGRREYDGKSISLAVSTSILSPI